MWSLKYACVCELCIANLCRPDVFWRCNNNTLQGGRWGEGRNALNDEPTCHLDQCFLPMEMTAFTWQQGGNTCDLSLFGSGSFQRMVLSFLGKAAPALELDVQVLFISDALKSEDDMWMLSRAYTACSLSALVERHRLLSFSNYSQSTVMRVD